MPRLSGACLAGFALLLAAACGGGGGGGGGGPATAFVLAGTVPSPGAADVPVDGTIAITFATPADLATVNGSNVRLLRADGTAVVFEILAQAFNPTNVQLRPLAALAPNELYRLVLKSSIESSEGRALGADVVVCFATGNPVPTVRPDQVVDLGDQLREPHYFGQVVRLSSGRILVLGGFRDSSSATDAIEEWDPNARTFRLLPSRLRTARAEFTATELADGRVLVAGGVTEPGGAPLATTELLLPDGTVVDGPPLNVARSWHAASRGIGAPLAILSGGFDAAGDPLDSIELLAGGSFQLSGATLPVPTAQHLHVPFGLQTIYVTAGNLQGLAAQLEVGSLAERQEGDIRFRTAAQPVGGDRVLVAGGDTRSFVIHDFGDNVSWGASDFFRDRRGAHSFTRHGSVDGRFLAAGGHRISNRGEALATMEIVEYLPVGPFGQPDVVVYTVENVVLPVPFAGHVGFNDNTGATVLAGGYGGDGAAEHSRRVVLVLSDDQAPTVTCD